MNVQALPTILVSVNGHPVRALIDTGCSKSVIDHSCVSKTDYNWKSVSIVLADGSERTFVGAEVKMRIESVVINVSCVVVPRLAGSFKVLLGMDVISKLGGVTIADGNAKFGKGTACSIQESNISNRLGVNLNARNPTPVDQEIDKVQGEKDVFSIEKFNFKIHFNKFWSVSWDWKANPPSQLPNRQSCFNMNKEKDLITVEKLNEWIEKGFLVEYDQNLYGDPLGAIPIYGIMQQNKNKVRPVFDFRRVNEYIDVYSGASEECMQSIRNWRAKSNKFALLDLSNAYLQIRVDPSMWRFQSCIINGKRYALTRMGFGLNTAPIIMTEIVRRVLGYDAKVKEATSSYIDDIFVDESRVSADYVKELFSGFGLECKDPVRVSNGNNVRVLGLDVFEKDGILKWKRGNAVRFAEENRITRREVYSICGQLIGIHPVAGWLRPVCSYIKRLTDGDWNSLVSGEMCQKIRQVKERLINDDPCRGIWNVASAESVVIWCDASSIAFGVVLEIKGSVIEDASWLRKKDDIRHINVAELEAALRGLAMCIKWNVNNVTLKCDNKSVVSWIRESVAEFSKVNTKCMSVLLIRRKLSMIKELCSEYKIKLTVEYVQSSSNKADVLTRIPKFIKSELCCNIMGDIDKLKVLHEKCHLGAKRMRFVCDQQNIKVSNEAIRKLIGNCSECQSIDPAPVKWIHGSLEHNKIWMRLAVDVTKFEDRKYLSIIDCGPSRFVLWKRIATENELDITTVLNDVFCERGAPVEVIVDNYKTFYAREFVALLVKWNVTAVYRAVNRPSGNGIVERNHRTVKRIASRSRISIEEAVWWYNNTPGESRNPPSLAIYNYAVEGLSRCASNRDVDSLLSNKDVNKFLVQELVWIKPSQKVRCTEKWFEGVIVDTISPNKYLVKCGNATFPRHVADLRHRKPEPDVESNASTDREITVQPMVTEFRRSNRTRHQPTHFNDYWVDIDSWNQESPGDVMES